MKKSIPSHTFHTIALAIFTLCNTSAFGQFHLPDFGTAFPQNEVSSIFIEIHPDSLSEMLLEENLYSDHEYPATFTFQSSGLIETVENVGFRLRGNTSREADKKSFKVSFNTFQDLQWQGLEKLNLNAYHNDPSLMRTKLCWDMYREAGLPGSRTSYTLLYINQEFRGIYLNTEHIDEEFAKRYIDNEGDGNLYKCLYPADLNYLGSNPDNYKVEFFGRRIYELKTNEWQDNYSDLYWFIDNLHHLSDDEFYCEIKKFIDIETYTKYAALEVLQGHWDGYIFNKNNFYLYRSEKTNRFIWLPYDLDNTLGIDWFGENWSTKDPYAFNNEERMLYDRLMDNETLRDLYTSYLVKYLDQFYDEDWYESKINHYYSLLNPHIENDVYYTLDYGFTPEDFEQSATAAWGNHVTQGLNAYFTQRRISALSQIENSGTPLPFYSNIEDNGPSPSIPIITAYAEGEGNLICAYEIDLIPTGTLQMLDDGVFPDQTAGDNIFSCFIEVENANRIDYNLFFEGQENQCLMNQTLWLTPTTINLQFNEVLALNSQINPDEFGEYEDWVELYNPGPNNINLSGIFMTDEQDNEDKWSLPGQIMQAGTFRLFFADNQPEQGNRHMTFRLSDNGESLWLYRMEASAFRLVDGISFPALSINESYGRATETSENLIVFAIPTPLAPNGTSNVSNIEQNRVSVFPNPANELIRFSQVVESVRLFDQMGKMILLEQNTDHIDVNHLSPGLYNLMLDEIPYRVIVR